VTFLPIVERELRAAARRGGTYRTRWVSALCVLGVWLMLLVAARPSSNAELGGVLFTAFGIMGLLFCLLAGVFLTADCLSEEKREGTMGLLFLTDLKGYDVVLGKLIANSVHSVYGLLAVFPVLGLPLLMGGVTGGEFARVMLVLVATLLVSLSLGMCVSAIARETRQTMAGTFLGMLLLSGAMPALWWVLFLAGWRPSFPHWLPNPIAAFVAAFDMQYRSNPPLFWNSLQGLAWLSLGLLALAALLLPHTWQEKARDLTQPVSGPAVSPHPDTSDNAKSAPTSHLAVAEPIVPRLAPAELALLENNPYQWLVSRRPHIGFVGLAVLGLLVLLFAGFFVGSLGRGRGSDAAFSACWFIAFGIHLVAKYLAALEATRQLHEDRRSGALELLLVTPLPAGRMVSGLATRLKGQFLGLKLTCVAVNVCLALRVLAQKRMEGEIAIIMTEVLLGGMVVLFCDFLAIESGGMWLGLRARRQHRAVLGTLARVMVVPWAAFLLVIFMSFSGPGFDTITGLLFLWFVVGVVNGVVFHAQARAALEDRFRQLVAGDNGPP
jgi:ABC-type transport system involved in cytochrome c biogenesis permease component